MFFKGSATCQKTKLSNPTPGEKDEIVDYSTLLQ
jgi:hypothetical protein